MRLPKLWFLECSKFPEESDRITISVESGTNRSRLFRAICPVSQNSWILEKRTEREREREEKPIYTHISSFQRPIVSYLTHLMFDAHIKMFFAPKWDIFC